jgi:hypothetical protein
MLIERDADVTVLNEDGGDSVTSDIKIRRSKDRSHDY